MTRGPLQMGVDHWNHGSKESKFNLTFKPNLRGWIGADVVFSCCPSFSQGFHLAGPQTAPTLRHNKLLDLYPRVQLRWRKGKTLQRGQHLFRNFNSIGIVFEYVLPPFRLVLHSSSDLGNERNLEWAKMGQNGKHMTWNHFFLFSPTRLFFCCFWGVPPLEKHPKYPKSTKSSWGSAWAWHCTTNLSTRIAPK